MKVAPTKPTTHLNQAKVHDDSSLHCQNEGTERDPHFSSKKQKISKDQLQGTPLTKQAILEVYSDIFTGIGKFPSDPYKFQLKPNVQPMRHAPRHVPIHL